MKIKSSVEKPKVVGLYKEGTPMPRIEYRIMISKKDVTAEYDLFEDLKSLLLNMRKY